MNLWAWVVKELIHEVLYTHPRKGLRWKGKGKLYCWISHTRGKTFLQYVTWGSWKLTNPLTNPDYDHATLNVANVVLTLSLSLSTRPTSHASTVLHWFMSQSSNCDTPPQGGSGDTSIHSSIYLNRWQCIFCSQRPSLLCIIMNVVIYHYWHPNLASIPQ